MEMTPETLEQRILKYRALAEVEDVSEPLLAIIDQLLAEREKDKAEIERLAARERYLDKAIELLTTELAAKDKLLSESEDNYLKASMKLTEMIANAANALDDDGADHYGQAVRQQAADIKALREALERIEGISNEDYKTGGFLTGEIPENWMELALIDAKEMATETLAATDPNREVEG